jgi:hypothetical protein
VEQKINQEEAISLYCCWPGSPSEITGPSAEPLVWDQAEIATNPNATVSITPSSINFGDVPVGQCVSTEPVTTPEPGVWLLCLAALGLLFRLVLLSRKAEPVS